MNCKPGDLAMIVRSWAGNEGRIVRCVRFAGVLLWNDLGRQPTWAIDPAILNADGELVQECMDCQLRPIRDNDGEDEMLRIAGKPREISHA